MRTGRRTPPEPRSRARARRPAAARRRRSAAPARSARRTACAARSATVSRTGCTSVGRARRDPQDLADRGLLLERFLGLVEQAHVVDGDRRLAGERPDQRDLLVVERPGPPSATAGSRRSRDLRASAARPAPCGGRRAAAGRGRPGTRLRQASARSSTWTTVPSMTARPATEPRVSGMASPASSVFVTPCAAAQRSRSPSTRTMVAWLAPHNASARSATACSTGWTSVGDDDVTRRISLIAVCWSSASRGLVEQAHVVDRDRRLAREGLRAARPVRGEQPGHRTPDEQRAVRGALAHQRHGEHRAEAELERVVARVANSVSSSGRTSATWTVRPSITAVRSPCRGRAPPR